MYLVLEEAGLGFSFSQWIWEDFSLGLVNTNSCNSDGGWMFQTKEACNEQVERYLVLP